MVDLRTTVNQASGGDMDAWRRLVQDTHRMVLAAAFGVLHNTDLARDAAQDAYLRAFRNLVELKEPGSFLPWLRRIVITVALRLRKAHRANMLRLDDLPNTPLLDDAETRWSATQRRQLATALLSLTSEERRLCDRRYFGRWSMARLALDAGVDECALRKRLQRIRDKLRKEVEMAEQRNLPQAGLPEFSDRILELLARPKLTDLPDNPTGRILELLRGVYDGFTEIELPEILYLADVREQLGTNLPYFALPGLCHIDEQRILRSDLALPLLLTARFHGQPLRLWASGKAYRAGETDTTHLEAFHQAEFLWMDDRTGLEQWAMTAKVHQSIDRLLPESSVLMVPTQYALCSQTWEMSVEQEGHWLEVLAWGVYSDAVVRHLGGEPSRHVALGASFGLERLAMLRYRLDDIRKVDEMSLV